MVLYRDSIELLSLLSVLCASLSFSIIIPIIHPYPMFYSLPLSFYSLLSLSYSLFRGDLLRYSFLQSVDSLNRC